MIMQYRIRHKKAYRTRLQFPALKEQKALCRQLEKELKNVSGVSDVQVRSLTGSIIFEHAQEIISTAQLVQQVVQFVYSIKSTRQRTTVLLPDETNTTTTGKLLVKESCSEEKKYHVSGTTLIVSGVYLFYLFIKRMFGGVITPVTLGARLFSLPAIAAIGLSLPIQRQALDNLKKTAKPDMGLISTGLLYASLLTGNVLAPLTVFWLFNLSSWLEDQIRTKTRQAVRDMLAGKVQKSWLVTGDAEIEVDVEQLQFGDTIRLRLGDVIQVDGIVLEGDALVSEASLTGESMPVTKNKNDYVLAGTTLVSGEIFVKVEKSGEETRLASIIRLIENAENDPGKLQRLSQRFSQSMVPISLSLAGLAFLFTGNILQAMAVLIITCPCAVRISTSVAVSSAMSLAAKNGILVKGGNYMELAGRVNVLVLDKTGTITDSVSEVTGVKVLDGRYGEKTLLQLAASVQKNWAHPLSRAVTEKAKSEGLVLLPCENTQLVVGSGVIGQVKGKTVMVGNRSFMESHHLNLPPNAVTDDQKTSNSSRSGSLFVAKGNRIVGLLETRSNFRDDAVRGIKGIKELGIKKLIMLTGDHRSGTLGLKEEFGFDEVRWEQTPEDKADWIRKWKLQNPEDVVAMVGDGINDTPAFAEADLSMAIGDGGADITMEYADIVLQQGGVGRVVDILSIGRNTLRLIKESYGIALGANGLLLMLTTLGVASPVVGAILHNMITVTTVTNAASKRTIDQRLLTQES